MRRLAIPFHPSELNRHSLESELGMDAACAPTASQNKTRS
jgi:hypothetical protein